MLSKTLSDVKRLEKYHERMVELEKKYHKKMVELERKVMRLRELLRRKPIFLGGFCEV